MRTTAMAVTWIVSMAFPSLVALGQSPVGDSASGTPIRAVVPQSRAPGDDLPKRFGLGLLGFATGAVMGYQTGKMIDSCDRCYFGASGGMIIGTMAGALIGTTILAIPSFGSACTRGARIRRALAGAGIGYLAGLTLIGPLFPYTTPLAEVGVALSTAFGGSLLQGRCL